MIMNADTILLEFNSYTSATTKIIFSKVTFIDTKQSDNALPNSYYSKQ